MAASLAERRRRLLRGGTGRLLLVLLGLLCFRSAVADWHDVPSGSMQPTILEGYLF